MNPEEQIFKIISGKLNHFVKFPKKAILLWKGQIKNEKYIYTKKFKSLIISFLPKEKLRNWSNDPAIYAYRIAGGERPLRIHGAHKWDVHHIYSKEFPNPPGFKALHAVKEGLHFTQSAGLIAVPRFIHSFCEDSLELTMLLRKKAFTDFGYDPECIFGKNQEHDAYGFIKGRHLIDESILYD